MTSPPLLPSAFAHLLPGVSVARGPLPYGLRADVDAAHLARALREAARGVGRTGPNPPVGAVVVDELSGAVLGAGFHAKAGERHAEIVALDAARAAGASPRGATLYVTLEPCVHHGRTPPCTDRVKADGIARVVVGAGDPNPRVNGKGIAALRAAGVRVDLAPAGPIADECAALIAPFSRALVDGRAYTILKIAASLDGRVAAPSGQARWITGEPAQILAHRLRDAVDAVVVGAGTVLADDPALTVRAVPGRSPLRVVVDGQLRTRPHARAFPGVVAHGAVDDDPARVAAFDGAPGVERLALPAREDPRRVDLVALLRALAARGALAALVEAGPGLATALLARGLVDEVWWLSAPVLLGGDGVPAVGALGLEAPADGPRLAAVHRVVVGEDALAVLRPRGPLPPKPLAR